MIHGDSGQRLRSLEADLVLADPPYGFEAWNELLEVAGKALIVAESDTPLSIFPDWEVVRSKTYGKAVVTILRPSETKMS